MIEGIRTAKKTKSARPRSIRSDPAARTTRTSTTPTRIVVLRVDRSAPRGAVNWSALGGALDAEPSGGHGLQPGRGDLLAAVLAQPVGAFVVFAQGDHDLVEGLPELVGQRLGLATLRGDLARIGEVRVVVQVAELGELVLQL